MTITRKIQPPLVPGKLPDLLAKREAEPTQRALNQGVTTDTYWYRTSGGTNYRRLVTIERGIITAIGEEEAY